MPDSCSSCGEATAPAARMTSRRARTVARTSSAQHLDTDTASALEAQPRRLGTRQHRKIRPPPCRLEKGLRGVPADAASLVHVEVTAAEVVAAIEVIGGRNPLFPGRLPERVQHRPFDAWLLDAPLVAGAVEGVGAAVIVLMAHEVRQHVVPAPARVAAIAFAVAPAVVVLALAAHVDHAVDRGASAEHLAARIADRATVEPRLGFGRVAPVSARIADAVEIADRHADPQVVIVHRRLRAGRRGSADQPTAGWPAGSRPSRRRR